MYAIVNIAGQQFKVEKGKKLFVHRLPGEVGDAVSFEKVLLISHGDQTRVGSPYISDAVVLGQITSHLRGDKILVFKKKRKKGYRVKNGHRQNFTQIEITGIGEKGKIVKQLPKKAKERASEAPAEEIIVSEKKPSAGKGSSKKAAEKSAGTAEVKEKKTTAKKVTEKKPAARKSSKPKE